MRERRLVYSQGIWALAILAAILLVIFGGVTDRLIPLFAVGAFLAFTLSQAAMVAHWRRTGGRHARGSMVVNGVDALATGATALVVLAAKFTEGVWVVTVIALLLISMMTAIHRHYRRVAREVAPQGRFCDRRSEAAARHPAVDHWTAAAQKALHFALTLSSEIEIVHVECESSAPADKPWQVQITEPARAAGRPAPKITLLQSPYSFVVRLIIDHVLAREGEQQDRPVAVVLAELVERHWYDYLCTISAARG